MRDSRSRGLAAITLMALLAPLVACERAPASQADTDATAWCDALPRPANAALETVDVGSDWYTVYRVEPGVFAIVEPRQFQEAISYLIVGTTRALLFDTGIGLVPLRPTVERLTTLPVTVLNSHTHFDHVGANAEFSEILAMDTPFTRANEQGRPHADLAGEVDATSFCGAPPPGASIPPTGHTRGHTRGTLAGRSLSALF